MTPSFWEAKAQRLYPKRGWFALATVAGILMFGGSGFLTPALVARLTGALGFATVVLAWSLFLVCYWFEPSKGALRADTWMGRRLPAIHGVMRWWSAVLLALCFAFGIAAPAWWLIVERSA
jgi:hypothetical protein